MKKESSKATYISIFILSSVAIVFITSVVFGILEMKKEEKKKQDMYEYLNTMCTPIEYGVDLKATKYSCDNIIFNSENI